MADSDQDQTAQATAATQTRQILADVYTFVRSREINKTISSFTFDHYIDEAKRRIMEPRVIRAPSGQSVGTRPSQLDEITSLEQAFGKALDQATTLAGAQGADNT